MRADLIHSVLAAGVNDPRRLVRWSTDPQALRALGVDPASLDLKALRGFAGLALKVRHNGLRDAFLLTFRLLNVAGLEIELFSEYALALATTGAALANTNEARAQDLIDFIQRWHNPSQATHALLWDLVRHEHALLQLAQHMTDVHTDDTSSRPTPGSVPRVRGAVRLHEMQHDPRAIVKALRQRDPKLDLIDTSPRALCYWRPEREPSVRIVEVDAFGFAALQAADGRRCVADLTDSLGLGRRPTLRVLRLLTELRDAGLLAFDSHVRGHSK